MKTLKLYALGLVVVLSSSSGAISHAESPPARLAGTFWWISPADLDRTAASWREELDNIQALGMDLLILSGSFPEPAENANIPMQSFFDEADRRGLRVFISTLSLSDWYIQPDAGAELARAEKAIGNIARLYGARKSFYGWYVPYELYVFWDKQADLIRTLYREVSAQCKKALDKPVMISPFFILDQAHILGDFRWAAPEEYQTFWTDLLRQAPIDIVALQDSGEHLSCYSLNDRRPFFAAMKAACDAAGKTFWANIESGELEVSSLEDYVSKFGIKTHVNNPKTVPYWRAVPAAKFAEKLRFAGVFTDTAITWGYQEYLRPQSGPLSKTVYEQYRSLGLTSGMR